MKRKLNCILLVDDNESDNFLHERVIKKAGVADQICVALNGKEALNFLTNNATDNTCRKPEVIFLDINMPVMDGWEFLQEYRNLGFDRDSNIVIVMLTTSINPSDKSKAEKYVKSDCFHYKPLTVHAINQIMQQHFPEYF